MEDQQITKTNVTTGEILKLLESMEGNTNKEDNIGWKKMRLDLRLLGTRSLAKEISILADLLFPSRI
jgi:hypothetical protein